VSKALSSWLGLSFCTLGYFYATSNTALAQVTSDGTVNTQVTENGNTAEITGGETRGDNLFHSFQDFSVPTGNEASFLNANDISNIFSRVTGGDISNIDGLISANGSANLFLINPAGIVFGEGARLDIGGSFYGSSASSILFEDGEFSATDLDNPPLLTINAPIGLGFRDQPGDIVNRSNFGLTTKVLDENFSGEFAEEDFTAINSTGLEVNPGKTLALIGGNIVLENKAGITAPEGIVELGGLSEAGTIAFHDDGSLAYPDGIALSNVSLTEDSQVEVRGDTGGSININSQNLVLSERSKIFAGIAEGKGSIDSQAGNITINSTDSVKLIGSGSSLVGLSTEINNHVGTAPNRRENIETPSNAVGDGGAVIINTSLLEISDQARITANSYAQGNSGNLVLNTDNIIINGGAIAGLIFEGTGDAGNITINNTDSIILNEGSNIQSQVLKDGQGNVGDIKIDTKTLSINEKFSFILADNASAGNAGNITINATDTVLINGGGGENLGTTLSAILSQVQMDVVGDAGDITIATPQLTLTNFGLISTNVRAGSVGNTGDVFLDVDTLTVDNGSVINALTENDFDGGNININANTASLSNGGKIVVSGDAGGNGGSINLNVADTLNISSSNPPELVPFQEEILLNTASEAGLFSSTVAGTGDGGSIAIQAGSIELANNASILATTSTGTGGDVSLKVDKTVELQNNSLISAEAKGIGNGGNISIDSNFIVASPEGNNDIIANASQGQGGNITIDAESLFGIEEHPLNDSTNDINASSEFALDGSINIDTSDINPVQGATELPSNVVEPEQTTAQTCEAGRGTANNGLAIAGKGGVPPAPDTPLNSENIISSEQNSAAFAIPQPIETSQGKIQPARGIKVSKSGKISLTAYRTNNAGERIPEIKPNCEQ
jgi:filamentous hemagglutinin family protein